MRGFSTNPRNAASHWALTAPSTTCSDYPRPSRHNVGQTETGDSLARWRVITADRLTAERKKAAAGMTRAGQGGRG